MTLDYVEVEDLAGLMVGACWLGSMLRVMWMGFGGEGWKVEEDVGRRLEGMDVDDGWVGVRMEREFVVVVGVMG